MFAFLILLLPFNFCSLTRTHFFDTCLNSFFSCHLVLFSRSLLSFKLQFLLLTNSLLYFFRVEPRLAHQISAFAHRQLIFSFLQALLAPSTSAFASFDICDGDSVHTGDAPSTTAARNNNDD